MSVELVESPDRHPFVRRPHRTVVGLSLPILVSLVAEPLTGLVDTAFVARLGAPALAALGVGTIVLSSTFWVFNFLAIGTQTEVARALGAGRSERAGEVTGLALLVSLALGLLVIAAGLAAATPVARWMEAEGEVLALATTYLRIRILGAPALLVTVAAVGCLRGLQDMRTPLWIALATNAANIALDALLVFGWGPVPALGVAGAAWASVVAQAGGAIWAVAAVLRRVGLPHRLHLADARLLFVTGRDLFLRTAFLTFFLVLTTRAATRAGPEAGAAHQAIRQVWLFAALALDAFAATGQSLVAYFAGAGRVPLARRVAGAVTAWALGTGIALALAMALSGPLVARWLVPPEAWGVFGSAWLLCAAFQPLNALSFVTDGIHWATRDYAYLRNAMLCATAAGALALWRLDEHAPYALDAIWAVTGGWITVRAAFGVLRVWPGVGAAPLAAARA